MINFANQWFHLFLFVICAFWISYILQLPEGGCGSAAIRNGRMRAGDAIFFQAGKHVHGGALILSQIEGRMLSLF